MNLRIYNGVLQQHDCTQPECNGCERQDVPVVNTQDTSSYNPEQSINTIKQVIKPREFWILEKFSTWTPQVYTERPNCNISDELIHVVELPKGSRVLSRNDIASVLLKYCDPVGDESFNFLLKELGFDND